MMPFQIQHYWSWIFIFQSLLVQLSVAHRSHNILARKTIDNLFQRGFSKAEKTRNAYIAVAITASIVLLVILVGLFLFIRKRRQVVDEPEAGVDHDPSWRIVDGKSEKKDWWWLGFNAQTVTPTELLGPDGRTRTQRLKAALRLRVPDQPILPTPRGTTTIPPLMPTDQILQPRYPESLERLGTRDSFLPVPSLPQLPTMTIHPTNQHLEPNVSVPPRALLSSSERRTLPRSPAVGRRRSRSLIQPIRNPFLPLGEPDGQIANRPNDSHADIRSHSIDIITSEQPSSMAGRTLQPLMEPASTPRSSGHTTKHRPSALQLKEPVMPPFSPGHRIFSPVLQMKGFTTPRSAGRRILSPVLLQMKGPTTPRSGRKIQFKMPGSSRLAPHV